MGSRSGTFKQAKSVAKVRTRSGRANPGQANPGKQTISQPTSAWMAAAGAIAILLVAATGIGFSTWLGARFILNPQSLSWLNQWLPNWIPVPVTGLKPPQTLPQIRTEIVQAGFIPGVELALGQNRSVVDSQHMASDLLVPVLERQPNCQNACEKIVALRLYQSTPLQQKATEGQALTFHLVTELAIAGPEELFVLTPLISTGSDTQGSTRQLPLTALKRFESKFLPPGIWLNLSGQWSRNNMVIYGKIVHYNPSRFHLSTMLEWSSTTREEPTWQPVIGAATSELVINQTVGMEPQFKIFQVHPRKFLPNPIQLEPISLVEPALDSQSYQKGLLLARGGLWSIGLQWLQSVKRQRGHEWTPAAQAQMELVRRHANATQTQAEKSWVSTNQQILANLIDGRWLRALSVFEASSGNALEIADLLRADRGQLQRRVESALQVNPAQLEVKIWGALLIAAQKNPGAAIAWLKNQPKTTSTDITRVRQLIKRIENSTNPPG